MTTERKDKDYCVQRLQEDEQGCLEDQCAAVSKLADEIWHEHYTPIIGTAQVDYMIERFQSAERILGDIRNNGHTYFIANYEGSGELIGYCGVAPKEDCLLVSKLYVRQGSRGKGIARSFIDEVAALCRREYGFYKIRLTVNKYNDGAIEVHKKNGFVIVDSVKADIGGGFFMDDYVMERLLL